MAEVITEERDRLRGFYPQLLRASGGNSGRRFFRVNTDDPAQATTALGLPILGSAYPGVADLLATGIEFIPQGPDWSVVAITYGDRVTGAWDLAVEVGEAYSEYNDSLGEIQIRADVNGNPIAETSVERSFGEVTVRSYKNSLSWLSAWQAIANKLNQSSVVLPPIRGLNEVVLAGPQTLLARTYAIRSVRTGVIEVSFTMGFAPASAWRIRYELLDTNGNFAGWSPEVDVYETMVWPGAGVLW